MTHTRKIRYPSLIHKLGYLAKLLSSDDKLSAQVFLTLASENVYSVSLIQQCRSLEQHLGCNCVQLCLHARPLCWNEIIDNDWKHTLSRPFTPFTECGHDLESIASSWNCYWDEALKYGIRGTKLIQNLYCCLSRPEEMSSLF